MVLILAAAIGDGQVTAAATTTHFDRAASTPKGQLKNPYTDFVSVAEEGRCKCMAASCNDGGGGEGMAAPLINQVWIYGDDDNTLFRVIALAQVV